MTVPVWQPGHLYPKGSVVQPTFAGAVSQEDPTNANFESGDTGWTASDIGWDINEDDAFEGTWSAVFQSGVLIAKGTPHASGLILTLDGITWQNASGTKPIGAAPAWSSKLGQFWTADEPYSSPDGNDWTLETDDISVIAREMIWVDELELFILGTSSGIYTSPDGEDWTVRSGMGTGNVTGLVWNGSVIVAVGNAGMSGSLEISTSPDGINWTQQTPPSGLTQFTDVAWADDIGLFVVCETTGEVATSPDGVTWTERTVPVLVSQVSSSGTRIVVIGATGDVATSDDGITWTEQTDGGWSQGAGDIAWFAAAELFVVIEQSTGAQNSAFTSPDGETWTERSIPTGTTDFDYLAERGSLPTQSALINDNLATVVPGQTIRARAYVKTSGADISGYAGLAWYNESGTLLSIDWAEEEGIVSGDSTVWRQSNVEASAPATAASVAVAVGASGAGSVRFDNVTWDYAAAAPIAELLFKAVQTDPGYSDTSEPDWPASVGLTVVDNEVTWEAVAANRVVWTAFPILKSGSTEPTWPLVAGGYVADNTISWETVSKQVTDEHTPASKVVAIAASKVFAGDDDIIPFSATVDPLDWTTENDAGYLPFGLQTHGSNPLAALGLYRGNLVAFNSSGFQMWQVDEDPLNMALLDAAPVPCTFPKSIQPAMNDLLFLTNVGVRNIAIAGASTNLQAGHLGEDIDSLIIAEIAALAAGEEPLSLFYPGAGQYWLIFGSTAYVLTMNGTSKSDMSWSKYTFPSDIDAATLLNDDLYLRSGDKVWRLDPDSTLDDEFEGAGTEFLGELRWQYLDLGGMGQEKMLHGVDLAVTGEVAISIGYDQSNEASVTDPYTVSGDTLPGTPIPIPVTAPTLQLRLTFSGDQSWEWSAAALFLEDTRIG